MAKSDNSKKWIKPRHKFIFALGKLLITPVAMLKYGVRALRFKEQGDRPYLILMNHQTPYDQFFVIMSFRGPVYFLATEDIFSGGFGSSLLRWFFAPIPIKKQTGDVGAVRTCIRVVKEGGTLAIAPEGNRTYSGKTEYINPSIAGLAKKLGLPVALYRIEGGYGAEPRWSDRVRKGKMRAYVSRVIEPEESAAMTNDEMYAAICEGLAVNEGCADAEFRSEKRAEYLERAAYVCPYCGFAEFESSGNVAECKRCGRRIEYEADKSLRGIGFDFPFRFFTEWYEYQKSFVNSIDITKLTDKPIFEDIADIYNVILYKMKQQLRRGARIRLYGDRVVISGGLLSGENGPQELVIPFPELTAAAALGRNKLNLYFGKQVLQFKGGPRFNALKYVNLYYRYNNIVKGEPDATFLGL